jgi:DNA-directed RNA polymerase subunit omega
MSLAVTLTVPRLRDRSSQSLHFSFILLPFRHHCGIGFLGDSRRSAKPEARRRKVSLRCAPKSVRRWCRVEVRFKIMKADLIKAASEVITNQQILVNMVSRRVRQLSLGHRPLVEYAPGLREADIALTEIANGKLTFESTLGQDGTAEPPARVVLFPGVTSRKSAKKAA